MEADGRVAASHLVSGRRGSPPMGTYTVYSKSLDTFAIAHPSQTMRYMVRFYRTPDGDNIGFHDIPFEDGAPVQAVDQLGQPLSDGCLRQSTLDAIGLWDWAPVGTVVVVVA